ncbi:MAG TPA: hypothetical protein VGL44_11180 [Gaiellales bacterium]
MSGAPSRRLRIAAVTGARPEQPAAPPLRLVSALSAAGRVARVEGLAADAALVHDLRLPGIGGRYLAGVAAHAHGRGWEPAEVAALIDAVELRSAMWIVAPSAGPLRRAGLIESGRGPRRSCARWCGERWAAVRLDERSLAAVARSGGGRAMCASAVSGVGAPQGVVEAVRGAGVRSGTFATGLAGALAVRWTVELLVAPALPGGSMMALRERIAAASRCGWCGVPMLGTTCRRCDAAARR